MQEKYVGSKFKYSGSKFLDAHKSSLSFFPLFNISFRQTVTSHEKRHIGC